jgi:hypothetical protein
MAVGYIALYMIEEEKSNNRGSNISVIENKDSEYELNSNLLIEFKK